jgi:hypothetical protein
MSEAKYKGKKWTVATDTAWKFDFEKMVAHPDLEHVDWMTAVGVQKSKGGSQGVLLRRHKALLWSKDRIRLERKCFVFYLRENVGFLRLDAELCRESLLKES